MLIRNILFIIIKEIISRLKNNKRYIFFYEIMRTFGTFLYKLRVRNNWRQKSMTCEDLIL